MSLTIKPGTRLFSAVDSTELIAVKAPTDPVDITIGGHPAVLSADERHDGSSVPGHDTGVSLGKRYVDPSDTIELLATKPGPSIPALNGEPLTIKEAKPLPASD